MKLLDENIWWIFLLFWPILLILWLFLRMDSLFWEFYLNPIYTIAIPIYASYFITFPNLFNEIIKGDNILSEFLWIQQYHVFWATFPIYFVCYWLFRESFNPWQQDRAYYGWLLLIYYFTLLPNIPLTWFASFFWPLSFASMHLNWLLINSLYVKEMFPWLYCQDCPF